MEKHIRSLAEEALATTVGGTGDSFMFSIIDVLDKARLHSLCCTQQTHVERSGVLVLDPRSAFEAEVFSSP